MDQDMDRRVLLSRRHSEVEQTPDALNNAVDDALHDVERELESQLEPAPLDGSANAADDLTPTPYEVAEAVFVGRRIGKRRRSEILRELIDRGYHVPPDFPPELGQPQKVRRPALVAFALAAFALLGEALFREANRGGNALELWVTLPDVIIALCAATVGVEAVNRTRRFRSSSLTTGGVLLFAALLISFPFHPSAQGVLVLVRLLGAVGVADVVQRSNRTELRRLVQILVAGVLASLVIAVGQIFTGKPLGWYPDPLGDAALVAGALVMALVLAGRLQSYWSYAGGFIAGFGSVFSGSRTNVLGLTLLFIAVVVGATRTRPKRVFEFSVAVAAAGATAVMLNPSAWTDLPVSAKANGDQATTRIELFKENVGAVRRHPIVGVGPGRYNVALEADGMTQATGFVQPPQVVAMSALAEGGILAGLSMLVIAGSIVGIARRRRFPATLPLVGLIAPLFTDHYMWTSVEGMAIVALALGVSFRLSRESVVREVSPQPIATS
jgi:hypothetical protein